MVGLEEGKKDNQYLKVEQNLGSFITHGSSNKNINEMIKMVDS